MLNYRYAEAAAEVLDILNHMNENDVKKVSQNFINFLTENASTEYKAKLDYSQKLNDMGLREETRGLLAIMYKNYWCPEEEKENLQKKFYENEQKYQEKLKEKYDSENMFSKKQDYTIQAGDSQTQLVEHKESFFRSFFNKIKLLFK